MGKGAGRWAGRVLLCIGLAGTQGKCLTSGGGSTSNLRFLARCNLDSLGQKFCVESRACRLDWTGQVSLNAGPLKRRSWDMFRVPCNTHHNSFCRRVIREAYSPAESSELLSL